MPNVYQNFANTIITNKSHILNMFALNSIFFFINTASPLRSAMPNFHGLKNPSKKYKQVLRTSPLNKAYVIFICPNVLLVSF